MKKTTIDTALPTLREAAEARFARGVVARLSERAEGAGPDIAERLRFAREKALESARRVRAEQAGVAGVSAGGAATLGLAGSPWWWRVASVLPIVALVGGLVLIQEQQTRSQISTAAEVDAALLGDDLPITAYQDPGFVEFLKAPASE